MTAKRNNPLAQLKEEWKRALRNPWYIGAWILLISLFVYSCEAKADFLGSEVSAYVGGQVITDDTDAIQVGLSLKWKYVTADMSTGIKRVSWRVKSEPEWEMDTWQSGSIFALRGYPFMPESDFRPLITWVHLSDVSRGQPFNNKEEPTSDYLGVGFTAVSGPLEVDLTAGYSGRECAWFSCSSNAKTPEVQFRIRVYFWDF